MALLLWGLCVGHAGAQCEIVPQNSETASTHSAPWASYSRFASSDSETDSAGTRPSLQALPLLFVHDTWHVITAPLHWHSRDFTSLAIQVVCLGGVASVDGPVRDVVQRNRTRRMDDALEVIEPLGSTYSFWALGIFGVAGLALDDPKAMDVAIDGFTADVIAGNLITPNLKHAFGRKRPFQTAETYRFEPFSNYSSFPSGHATRAFAVASVVAAHYHSWWVKGTAYSLAGLVALARVNRNVHFASDVTAGALIGTAVGRAIVHFNDRKGTGSPRGQQGHAALVLTGDGRIVLGFTF